MAFKRRRLTSRGFPITIDLDGNQRTAWTTYHSPVDFIAKDLELGSSVVVRANPDGSLDVYVQSTPPSDPKQLCNWLESPEPTTANNNGQFLLFLRMYWPEEKAPSIIDGSWSPPPVRRTP